MNGEHGKFLLSISHYKQHFLWPQDADFQMINPWCVRNAVTMFVSLYSCQLCCTDQLNTTCGTPKTHIIKHISIYVQTFPHYQAFKVASFTGEQIQEHSINFLFFFSSAWLDLTLAATGGMDSSPSQKFQCSPNPRYTSHCSSDVCFLLRVSNISANSILEKICTRSPIFIGKLCKYRRTLE